MPSLEYLLNDITEGGVDTLLTAGYTDDDVIVGSFMSHEGRVFDFDMGEDYTEIYEVNQDSEYINDYFIGALQTEGVEYHGDSAYEYFLGFSGLEIHRDAGALKCKPGNTPCGRKCLPKGQKCRMQGGHGGLGSPGGRGRGLKIGGAIAGAAALGGVGALVGGTKAGRGMVRNIAGEVKGAAGNMKLKERASYIGSLTKGRAKGIKDEVVTGAATAANKVASGVAKGVEKAKAKVANAVSNVAYKATARAVKTGASVQQAAAGGRKKAVQTAANVGSSAAKTQANVGSAVTKAKQGTTSAITKSAASTGGALAKTQAATSSALSKTKEKTTSALTKSAANVGSTLAKAGASSGEKKAKKQRQRIKQSQIDKIKRQIDQLPPKN